MSPDTQPALDTKECQLDASLIREILAKRGGWEIKTVTKEEAGLVPLDKHGAVGCMDGREIEAAEKMVQKYSNGPKVPGGILGVALACVKDGTEKGIAMACELIKNKGFFAGAHDIVENHCGAKKLAESGIYKQIGLPKLTASAQEIVDTIQKSKGIFVHHKDSHKEIGIIFNLDPELTRHPDGNFFQADVSWLTSLGVDPRVAVEFYALTVEQLKTDAKVAYIVGE